MQFDLSSGYQCTCSAGRGTVHCAILTQAQGENRSHESQVRELSAWRVCGHRFSPHLSVAQSRLLDSWHCYLPCSLTLLLFVPAVFRGFSGQPDLGEQELLLWTTEGVRKNSLEISKQRLLGEGECLVSQRVPSADCDTIKLVIYGFHLLSDALSCGESEQPCSPLDFDLSFLSLWQNLHPIIHQ